MTLLNFDIYLGGDELLSAQKVLDIEKKLYVRILMRIVRVQFIRNMAAMPVLYSGS